MTNAIAVKSPKTQMRQTKTPAPLINSTLMVSPPEPSFLNVLWSEVESHQRLNQIETVYQDLIAQAKTKANHQQFPEAVAIVASIPKNSRYHEAAQQYQEAWSLELIEQANNAYQQAKLGAALALLDKIPSTTSQSARVSEIRTRWIKEAKPFNQALAAQKANDWPAVLTALNSLEDTPLYHSLAVQNLLQQAMNKQFEPDAALMQMANEASAPATAIGVQPALPSASSVASNLPIAPLPTAESSPIDLHQAIAWAQPLHSKRSSFLNSQTKPNLTPNKLAIAPWIRNAPAAASVSTHPPSKIPAGATPMPENRSF